MSSVLAFAVAILILYIILKLLQVPFKIVLNLILNAVVGGITLILVNFFGSIIGIHVTINIITALIAGFFGLPGVIVLIIINYL